MSYTVLEISKEEIDEMEKIELIKVLLITRPEGWQRLFSEFHSILFNSHSNTLKNISQFKNLTVVPGFLLEYYVEKYNELFELNNISNIPSLKIQSTIVKMLKLIDEGDQLYYWLSQIYLYQSGPGSEMLM